MTFRLTEEMLTRLQERADEAGCHSVSEFARRKVIEEPEETFPGIILLILEYCRSNSAHLNIICEVMGLNKDARQAEVDVCKQDLMKLEAKMMGGHFAG